jgi:hypothetical protein
VAQASIASISLTIFTTNAFASFLLHSIRLAIQVALERVVRGQNDVRCRQVCGIHHARLSERGPGRCVRCLELQIAIFAATKIAALTIAAAAAMPRLGTIRGCCWGRDLLRRAPRLSASHRAACGLLLLLLPRVYHHLRICTKSERQELTGMALRRIAGIPSKVGATLLNHNS